MQTELYLSLTKYYAMETYRLLNYVPRHEDVSIAW